MPMINDFTASGLGAGRPSSETDMVDAVATNGLLMPVTHVASGAFDMSQASPALYVALPSPFGNGMQEVDVLDDETANSRGLHQLG